MKNKKARLANAWSYLGFCVKQGIDIKEPEELATMSDDEIIDYADYLMDMGDAAAEASLESLTGGADSPEE